MPRRKLEVRQFVPEITPYTLVALMALVATFGVQPELLCEGMTFSSDDLMRGTLVSNRQAWRMIRRALRLTGRADLGLALAQWETVSDLGLTGIAMSVQRTFGDAVALALLDQNQNGSLVIQELDLDSDADFAILIARPRIADASLQPFLVEELFGSAFMVTRDLLGADFAVSAMEFAYPAPAYVERYREVFGCPMAFNCPQNRVFIERRWLAAPLPGASSVIAAELHALIERRASTAAAPADIVDTVEALLAREDRVAFSISRTAQVLDMSVRTLRRRLDEAGTSFRQLSDRSRARVAMELLHSQRLTVAAVGQRLGFSDVRAFRRAFKRWQGQVPGQLRQAAVRPR
jgi:AraC-like DNA-binding protein